MAATATVLLQLKPSFGRWRTVQLRRQSSFSSPAVLSPRFSGESIVPIAFPAILERSRPVLRVACASSGGSGSDQVDGKRNHYSEFLDSVRLSSWPKSFLGFVMANFLPLALISGMTFGLLNPNPGCLAHKYSFSRFSTCGIFFISGLMLRSEEFGAAVEAWPAGLFGLAVILLLTPLFSRLILQIPLSPPELITGLALFFCMPTTLSSGVALTRLAGGNSALALAMTLVSNLLGIITVPVSLSKLIGGGAGISLPTNELVRSLTTTILVPLILGKVFRDAIKGLSDYIDKNSRSLSMITAVLLSLVPWMQVSRSRLLLLSVKPTVFGIVIALGMLLHIILLAFNTLAVQGLSEVTGGSKSVFAKEENSRAVILVSSQKTLPVLVAVVEQLQGTLGESGLLVLPCVGSHIIQIIIDSFLVSMWVKRDQMRDDSKQL